MLNKIQPVTLSGTDAKLLNDLGDFSLVSGGPLYQLWRRTRLAGDELQFVRRRVLVAVLIAWVPLLLLSVLEGNAWGGNVALSFLQDVEAHARMLVAVPLLILAEVAVHRELAPIVRCFVDHGLVTDATRPRFDAAVASAMKLRNSIMVELLLIVFVYAVAVPFVWRDQVALDINSWYATAEGGRLRASLAGWWMGLVSMPVFLFLTLRWYFRLFVWARFLWQVSRIDLDLEPTHPDGTAGLHFLALVARVSKSRAIARRCESPRYDEKQREQQSRRVSCDV